MTNSKDEQKLPTAGKCPECGTTAVFVNGEGSITCDRCGEVWKAVRRKDAEKAMRVAKGEKYQQGYVNGMEEERQKVLDLIDQQIEEVEINPVDEEVAKKISKKMQKLREEIIDAKKNLMEIP